MKKILRILASRYFLAVVCILLEFAQLVAVFMLLREHFVVVNALGWVLQAAVLIYILNRDDIPEFKVPWLLLLLLIPVTGAFIFLLFSPYDATQKQLRRHDEVLASLRPYAARGESPEILRDTDPAAYGQARYLQAASHAPCHACTQIDYYPLGDDFFPALLRALESAERFILLEYFIIQPGEVWDAVHAVLKHKAAAGLEVYVMYDDFGCIATLPSKYYETLRDEGIHAMPSNRLRPVFSRSHNNRDHRKIVVIDGRVGFTGGVNLADRYMNLEVVYGHWKDSAIRLEGPAVQNLTALFIASWNTQSDDRIDPDLLLEEAAAPRDAPGFALPFGDGPAPIYPDRIAKNVILNLLYAAERYVYITTPYLICDHELLAALRLAAGRGVDVRIITPHIPDKKAVFLMTRSNYRGLVDSGVQIYEYTPGFVHAKTVVSDDKLALCGSVNLDYRSLVHNYEVAVWMYGADCIPAIRDDLLAAMEKGERITPETARLSLPARLAAELMKVFSVLM